MSERKNQEKTNEKPLSLAPLEFEEVLEDLLKIPSKNDKQTSVKKQPRRKTKKR